ncbi:MAG: DUF3224 domain-containing protein [Bifidobacteriaceae bacterium]|jgi:hypothetical protein|nr:DUF3224 domain-containing protein [Bifidobacteriaceae bacterium]
MRRGSGEFTVTETFEPPYFSEQGVALARGVFRKHFTGILTGTSQAQVLRILTPVEGTSAYVGLEWFTGTLNAKAGALALIHSTVLTGGVQTQRIGIVPESGTDGLAGLSGSMTITDRGDRHTYALTYHLP